MRPTTTKQMLTGSQVIGDPLPGSRSVYVSERVGRMIVRRLGFRRRGSGGESGGGKAPSRSHPALVTVERLSDDGEVFGEALPVVPSGTEPCALWMSRPTPWPGPAQRNSCCGWRSS